MTEKTWVEKLFEKSEAAGLRGSVDGHGFTRVDSDGPMFREKAGRGRMGGDEAGGPGGSCVCLECGHKVSHETGSPCDEITCSECGSKMTREED